jgi:hypothetical protein
MLQNHRRIFILHVLTQVVAELRVTVTVGIALPVLSPEYLVLLQSVKDAFTTFDCFFNFLFVFFIPKVIVFLSLYLFVTI